MCLHAEKSPLPGDPLSDRPPRLQLERQAFMLSVLGVRTKPPQTQERHMRATLTSAHKC